MWNVHPDREKNRGGFQNADLGKTQFDRNYGPEFGVDYARFSDPPDIEKDHHLETMVKENLSEHELFREIEITVRNEFVILKGKVPTLEEKTHASDFVRALPGVKEVINQLEVL